MHDAPFEEIARQSAPEAASALQIENGTKDISRPYGYAPHGQKCAGVSGWGKVQTNVIGGVMDKFHAKNRCIANQLIFSYDIYANLSAFAQYSGKICMKY